MLAVLSRYLLPKSLYFYLTIFLLFLNMYTAQVHFPSICVYMCVYMCPSIYIFLNLMFLYIFYYFIYLFFHFCFVTASRVTISVRDNHVSWILHRVKIHKTQLLVGCRLLHRLLNRFSGIFKTPSTTPFFSHQSSFLYIFLFSYHYYHLFLFFSFYLFIIFLLYILFWLLCN